MDLLFPAAVVFFILLFAGVTYYEIHAQITEIREALERRGARDIRISWEPLDFDRNNHTYTVDYRDKRGQPHRRSCKIHEMDSTIYWEDDGS